MDEAERCHRLAYISYGKLLAQGTTAEVIQSTRLTTWSVTGPDLVQLSQILRHKPGVEQVVAFGNTLHVSGRDSQLLESTLSALKTSSHQWAKIKSGLEDVFISLMDTSEDNYKSK